MRLEAIGILTLSDDLDVIRKRMGEMDKKEAYAEEHEVSRLHEQPSTVSQRSGLDTWDARPKPGPSCQMAGDNGAL